MQNTTVDGRQEVASKSGKDAAAFGGKQFMVHVSRIAGVSVATRPCGVIVWWERVYHHESLSQLYLLVDQLFSQSPAQTPALKYFIFDYSCGARQFFLDREGPGPAGVFGKNGVNPPGDTPHLRC